MMNNIGFYVCLFLAVIFFVFVLLFALMGEKSATFINGFHELPKMEQKHYDRAWIAKDQRNACIIWVLILVAGCLSAHYIHDYCGLAALLVWMIVFAVDPRMGSKKNLDKYRTK